MFIKLVPNISYQFQFNYTKKQIFYIQKDIFYKELSENIIDISERQIYKEPKTLELLVNFVGLVKAYLLEPKEVFDISEISKEYLFIIQAYDLYEIERNFRDRK